MCRWPPISAGCWTNAPATPRPRRRFLDELEDHMTEDAAEETLKTVVSWARFGELFSYDDDAAMFSLENPT